MKACIFDLDGVIVDTAVYHYKAWRRMANELGFDFSEKDNEKLKGVSRMDSLDLILKWGKITTMKPSKKQELAKQKNDWYVSFINKMGKDEILPGILPFLNELKKKKIKIALGSASKNAVPVLKRTGIRKYFDAIVDGTSVEKGKPDPEVFLKGAAALKVPPNKTIVFEDAVSGIDAALSGGFYAVGVGSYKNLGHAHLVINSFRNITFKEIVAGLQP